MTLTPCGHRLTIKPFKLEEVDEAYSRAKALGINIVRENEKREDASVDKGTVLEIGPDCWPNSKEPWCKVGDTIYFAKFSAKLIELSDGTTIGLLNDDDVVAVVKE